VRQLTEQAPQVKGESEPRTIIASPLLLLTQAAVMGLSTRSDMEDAIDIGETAVAIAAAALNALKRRTSRDGKVPAVAATAEPGSCSPPSQWAGQSRPVASDFVPGKLERNNGKP
jgi:hypothetical protein